MKPLLVSSGEPAGIGPDLCLALANTPHPVVIAGDKTVLYERAARLGYPLVCVDYEQNTSPTRAPNTLTVLSTSTRVPVIPGEVNAANADYVIAMLTRGVHACLKGEFSGLVTAPVHKEIINQAGLPFTGHTELLAQLCGVDTVVMMLASEKLKVALVTTHLPLHAVPRAITQPLLRAVVKQVHQSLQEDFGITHPYLLMAGLNPHAGEGGYLGHEEIDTLIPAIQSLQNEGIHITGPHAADTLFSPHNLQEADAFISMYHDQGLPVLKYASFGQAVNITLGLPIIRTSVDHGTALSLAGLGHADCSSLLAAVDMAAIIAQKREALNACA